MEMQLSLTYFVKFCAFQGLLWNFARNLSELNKVE